MKHILHLAWRSIVARRSTAILTLLAVALSVALFAGVEKTRRAAPSRQWMGGGTPSSRSCG